MGSSYQKSDSGKIPKRSGQGSKKEGRNTNLSGDAGKVFPSAVQLGAEKKKKNAARGTA